MLRAVVPYNRAIEVNDSPERTSWTRNVGLGPGVGRTNDGAALSDAAAGAEPVAAAEAWADTVEPIGDPLPVGSHPAAMTPAPTRTTIATVRRGSSRPLTMT